MQCSMNDFTSSSRSRLTPVIAHRLTRGMSPQGSVVGRTSSAEWTACARQGDSWPLTTSLPLARQTVLPVDCTSWLQEYSPSQAATISSLATSPGTSKAMALTSRAVWDLCSWAWCSSASSAWTSCGSISVRLPSALDLSTKSPHYRSKLNAPTLVIRPSDTLDLTVSNIIAAGLMLPIVCLMRAISSCVNRSHCRNIRISPHPPFNDQYLLYSIVLCLQRLFVVVLQIQLHCSTHAQSFCRRLPSDMCQPRYTTVKYLQ